MKSLLIAFAAACSISFASADEPKAIDKELSTKLIGAIENADHQAFISDGDDRVKAMPKAQFEAVAVKIGPMIKDRKEMTYLGELNQKGARVTLWKITFASGDDMLATLSVKEGKVAGFYVQ